MNRAKWFLICGACSLGLVWLIYRPSNVRPMPLSNDDQMMQQEVVKRIPIGSDIGKAQSVMRAGGFRCQMMKHTAFAEDNAVHGGQKYHAPADFLYCDQTASTGLFASRRWQVAIVDKHNKVSDVYVSISLSGL